MGAERQEALEIQGASPRPWTKGKLSGRNPATGQIIGSVPVTSPDDVPEMYRKARRAQQSWGALSVKERVGQMARLRLTIVDGLESIARQVAESTGKTEAEVLSTELLLVLSALQYVERHAPKVLRRRRRPTPVFLFSKLSYVEYGPKGVVLVIGPWNFPLQLSLVPVLYALAAGNAVILKPSEMTPTIGLLIEQLIVEAGMPAHVVQVAHGEGDVGAVLVTPPSGPGPDHIFFTGSVATGKIIQADAARQLIPTTLELSGKDAMIVFADAPLERAVEGAVWGAFMHLGQVCVSTERLYVERIAHGEFVRQLQQATARLRQGGPRATPVARAAADLGCMTTEAQGIIVREQVEDALERGATLLSGPSPDAWNGAFIPPVILGNVTDRMRIAREETFGPVLAVFPFDSEDDVVAKVNGSPFGLNASVWTRDEARGRRVASRLQTGSVAVNDVIVTLANQHLPFGGVKQSGIGANHGETGLKTFSNEKAVVYDVWGRRREVHWFPYEGKASLFVRLLRNYFQSRRSWIGFLSAFSGLLRRSR